MSFFALLFFAVFTFSVIAAFVDDPAWGAYAWIIVYFFDPNIRWWYSQIPALRYSMIIILTLFISYLIRKRNYSQNKLFDLPQTKWIASMLLMCGLINFWAVWPERHWMYFIAFAKIVAIISVIYKVIDTPKRLERMLWIYMLSVFYIGWIAYSGGRTYGSRLEGVGFVDGRDANAVAAAVVSIIPIIVYYVFYESKIILRGIALVFLAFSMNCLVIANSRGGFLGLIFGMLYYFFRTFFSRIPGKATKRFRLLLISCCGVGLFLYLADTSFWERMSTLHDVAGQASEHSGRTFFWLKTFDLVREHPFGVGIWGYQFLSPQFIPPEMLTSTGRGAMRAVHSTFFQSLAEYGYIGIILLAGIIFSSIRFMVRARKFLMKQGEHTLCLQSIALESAFVAFLIPSIFIDRLYAQTLYINIILIACFGNIYMVQWQQKSIDEGYDDAE